MCFWRSNNVYYKSFIESFYSEVKMSLGNNYQDNYDYYRYGDKKLNQPIFGMHNLINQMKSNKYLRRMLRKTSKSPSKLSVKDFLEANASRFDWLHKNLDDDESRTLLVKIMAFRYLGFRKVKLPQNTPAYWRGIKDLDILAEKEDYIQTNFLDWKLYRMDLNSINIPIKLYSNAEGAYLEFVLQQYACESEKGSIKVEPGDIVIDAGSCYGETLLNFAYQVGNDGHVYGVEFIPENLLIMEKNISMNSFFSGQLTVVDKAVWSKSDLKVNYLNNGPGSKVCISNDFKGFQNKTSTITIDDLVLRYDIPKIDFIKMDIEGAEMEALHGARETLRRFTPKLAICVYHNLSDFVDIPEFITSLELGYKLYLRHATIHKEETVLFAKVQ